ncbi:P protein-like isoform X2 [Drosophila montana]|uniref:P protein-like isoform X2 n=1 Tax=Drosophila montana TaxID=40370 RepID=UPI00313E9AA3
MAALGHITAARRSYTDDYTELNDEQLRRRNILRRVGTNVKITIFVILWIYFTVFLIKTTPHKPQDMVVPLQSQRAHLSGLRDKPNGDEITITLSGPVDEDSTYNPKIATETQPRIIVTVERFDQAANKTAWKSKEWKVILFDPDSSKVGKVKKYFTLETNTKQLDSFIRTAQMRIDSDTDLQVSLLNLHNEPMAVYLSINSNPMNANLGVVCGILLLIFLYVLIIWDITDRTLAALLVATAAIGVLSMLDAKPALDTIVSWIDMETLMLLFAMMIMVSILTETGVFEFMSVYAYQMSKGNVWRLLFFLCMFTGFLSAFLDNVTMVLLMVPVTIRLCESLALSTTVVLISIAIFANIGGSLTPVGDPPNVVVATDPYVQQHGIDFGTFIIHMFPGVFLSMIFGFIILYLLIRKKLFASNTAADMRASLDKLQSQANRLGNENTHKSQNVARRIEGLQERLKNPDNNPENVDFQKTLSEMKANCKIKNKPLLIKCCIAFTFAILMFFLQSLPAFGGATLCWVAMLAAILLLILTNKPDIDVVLEGVEWGTLIFFAALFVLMESVVELGVIDFVGELTIGVIMGVGESHQLMVSILLILWLVIKLANNRDLGLSFPPLIWSLLFGACFGGNGTLIGASANVVTAGIAHQYGYHINFKGFFIIGFPIMLATMLVASIYLLIAHCLCTWHDPPSSN